MRAMAFLTTGLLLLAAFGSADTVKPGAPIEVKGTLGETTAVLDVLFHSAGRDVQVELRGTDGLVIAGSAIPVRGRSVETGETLHLEVGFVPGADHSNLAVIVSGNFGGHQRSRAASFTLGSAGRPKVSAAEVDAKGNRVKLGRAERVPN